MLKLNAVLTCDRCGASVGLNDVRDSIEVWQRMRDGEALWGEDDDGNDLCPECVSKHESPGEPMKAPTQATTEPSTGAGSE
jgi:hypothetical protein